MSGLLIFYFIFERLLLIGQEPCKKEGFGIGKQLTGIRNVSNLKNFFLEQFSNQLGWMRLDGDS